MTINNDETTHENDMHVNPDQLTAVQKLLKFLQSVRKPISDYGIQTVSGLTVLGIWYRYFS